SFFKSIKSDKSDADQWSLHNLVVYVGVPIEKQTKGVDTRRRREIGVPVDEGGSLGFLWTREGVWGSCGRGREIGVPVDEGERVGFLWTKEEFGVPVEEGGRLGFLWTKEEIGVPVEEGGRLGFLWTKEEIGVPVEEGGRLGFLWTKEEIGVPVDEGGSLGFLWTREGDWGSCGRGRDNWGFCGRWREIEVLVDEGGSLGFLWTREGGRGSLPRPQERRATQARRDTVIIMFRLCYSAGFTVVVKTDQLGNIIRYLCARDRTEMYRWVAAILNMKHPEGIWNDPTARRVSTSLHLSIDYRGCLHALDEMKWDEMGWDGMR
ncbi:hypothetical protein QZH41_010814, partial [Actinostola sp. cb2023]